MYMEASPSSLTVTLASLFQFLHLPSLWLGTCQKDKAWLAMESRVSLCLCLSSAQTQDVTTLDFYDLKSGGQTQVHVYAN